MKVYPTSKIRNIALVGHGGTGKTSLAEAMIFNTGATSRLGKVDDGNTVADYLPEEVKKKITISTSLVPCEYRDHKINVLDTPGFADFYFEVVGAARVTDTLVMMLSASAGVEVQTEVIWEDFPIILNLAVEYTAIRSAPPISAHLAVNPLPAPNINRERPCLTCSESRLIISLRLYWIAIRSTSMC
jgi:small GTP-binding protein